MRVLSVSVATLLVLGAGCGGSDEPAGNSNGSSSGNNNENGNGNGNGNSSGPFEFGPVNVDPEAPAAAAISEYQLLHAEGDGTLRYNDGVRPYTLNTQLFSDYALKERAIYVPPGQTVSYDATEVFDFPVGTVVVKTFSFPADFRAPTENVRIVETRVMIHTADGWENYPYLWNEEGTDASYAPAGAVEEISFINANGDEQTATYLVPQRNQCRSCHEIAGEGGDPEITLIGPKARHLNGPLDGQASNGNQLDNWANAGLLTGLPASDVPQVQTFDDADAGSLSEMTFEELDPLARGYLDINCGHCHNPNATEGVASQLWLDIDNDDPFNLGVCKRPGSAGKGTGGLEFDIVPGNADASIIVFRVETEEIGAMMPQIGRSLQHQAGAELIRAWVDAMPPQSCE